MAVSVYGRVWLAGSGLGHISMIEDMLLEVTDSGCSKGI